MVNPNDLRALVLADGGNSNLAPQERRRALADAVEALDVDEHAIVGAATLGLDSDDRNVRAVMLRVLALFGGPSAAAGVLRGLGDPVRRVREVAIRAAEPHHLDEAAVIEALRRIAEDGAETGRLRRTAFAVLSSATTRRPLPDVTQEAIAALLQSERFRLPLLRRMCSSLVQTDETRALLRECVRTGTKDEAVMATRALCGQVLLRTDIVPEAERRRVRSEFDREDDLHRWVPAPLASELVARWAEAERGRR